MIRHNRYLSGYMSGLLSLTLMFTAIPMPHIHAEDEADAQPAIEEAQLPAEDSAEPVPAVFIVTDFVDFDKNDDGSFKNMETQERYGKLTALPGTAADQLGLPEDLELTGYWEADGPEIASGYKMEDLEWKLKSDIGEVYSEASLPGEYVFQPDFEAYCSDGEHTDIDEIRLDESLKMLTVNVLIEAPEEAPIEDVSDDTVVEEPAVEEPVADIPVPDEIPAADDTAVEEPTVEEPVADIPVPDEIPAVDDGSVIISEAPDDSVNIFDQIDDSALTSESADTYGIPTDEPVAEPTPEPVAEPVPEPA
ncbi:MAG: hypothetical protein Q4B57_00490, partial [Eubacteriales bacterium]|nr:hypothetical protein [Eubacteriales bacterium]